MTEEVTEEARFQAPASGLPRGERYLLVDSEAFFFLWSSQDHAEEGRKTQERYPSLQGARWVCKHSSFGIEMTDKSLSRGLAESDR